jgi:putative membrane protein
MIDIIIYWVISAVVLYLVANIVPGVAIDNIGTAFFASLIMALVNMLIKPLLTLLTLPINFLTFGLFSFVISAGMFGLTAAIVPGFEVSNFWTALLGSLLLGFLSALVQSLVTRPNRQLTH